MSKEEQYKIKQDYYNEAMRYMANAKDTLKIAGKEDNHYIDDKYVKTACGIAYNGVLKALDGYFIIKDIKRGKGRKSIEFYQNNISKIDKKLNSDVSNAYKILHLSGYYDGVTNVRVINEGFELANNIIKKIEP